MASPEVPSQWDGLPDEILLQIISYLEPHHITKLQVVSRKLRELCFDDRLWKRIAFESSSWYQSLKTRRSIFRPFLPVHDEQPEQPDDIPQCDSDSNPSPTNLSYQDDITNPPPCDLSNRRRALQDMANWDPVFPDEQVSWYDEYIQRQGPICVNWMQTPRMHDRGVEATIEARGMALYSPHDGKDGDGTMLAVSPLDDGSVCLWDVKGTRFRQGGIVAMSKPDILFIDGPSGQNSKRSKRIDTGVTECISVNNGGHRAFFAVQSHLIEVDLNTLQVVSRESFEWSITTLSSAQQGVPLTVGTSLGIHLHDTRARAMAFGDDPERLDGTQWNDADVYRTIFDPKPLPPYAPLAQPTPISILHLPQAGSHNLVSDDIYVSGRFSSILHYDRRNFPAIAGSIHSGALIKSLAALPYPFSTVDAEVRRQAELTSEQVARLKNKGDGWTLIAGGGYKSKGSLELYGLRPATDAPENSKLQTSVMKNRQTAASSTILSVANHGTKIVVSDGSGFLKWFERDGFTEVRRMRIGHSDASEPSSLFASMPASDDLARKILSTKSEHGDDMPNDDNILLWTGEKLGLVSFTKSPIFDGKELEAQDPESAVEDEKRLQYAQRMRQALARQADEVKFIGSLATSSGSK